MTYEKYLKLASKRAISLNKEPEAIKLLMLELSNKSGAEFLAAFKDEISEELIKIYDQAIDKYLINNYPVQYILGYSYFYGYKMKVDERVLIPRRETEELVAYVLSYYDEMFENKEVNICDIGTGSGNIIVALKAEEPSFNAYASDISEEAISVAKENAKNNDVDVKFLIGNMVDPLKELNIKFDIVVSNPPYIPSDEFVEDIVKDNEPNIALFGGVDGMFFYEEIFKNIKPLLNDKAFLAFEHSFSKKQAMIDLARKYFPNAEIISIKDMQEKDRFTIVKIN
jgi:release factor glutamine methyltransferase